MCLSTSVPVFQTFLALFENTVANVFCGTKKIKPQILNKWATEFVNAFQSII